jgi:hypothetical protein
VDIAGKNENNSLYSGFSLEVASGTFKVVSGMGKTTTPKEHDKKKIDIPDDLGEL